jgi:FdhD protein
MAGCPVIAAVGAPSSLAVASAEEYNMTLAGFLRADRMNIYAGAQRIS